MNSKKVQNYYLGLDIGTDSVGYAVTDTTEYYNIPKYNRKPLWGVQIFDEAELKQSRRAFRTARRRLDRRQHRIKLLQQLFAKCISEIDINFYRRLKESALYQEDRMDPNCVFNDEDYTDKQFHKEYPTIHHLIVELINNPAPHDPRLVYIACAWLIAHRGHFLSAISEDHIEEGLDFSAVYNDLIDYLSDQVIAESYLSPWKGCDKESLAALLTKKETITQKYKALKDFLYEGKTPPKKVDEELQLPVSFDGIIKLLSGGTYSCKDLFGKEEYSDLGPISLSIDEEKYESILVELGDDAELIAALKAIYDWSILSNMVGSGQAMISASKIEVYEQHKKDLADLKSIIRKYIPEKYKEVFRESKKDLCNYVAYSGNIKNASGSIQEFKKASKDKFYDYLKKLFKSVDVEDADAELFNDIKNRIDTQRFMPKQIDGDNRVLPYQLYYVELKKILDNAAKYISFIGEKDEAGFSGKDKILAIMKHRVPYFVGPLNSKEYGWAILKEGKKDAPVFPWTYDQIIDFDKSENEFIRKMTNTCTYLPAEDVIPKQSLLYQKFEVLNEINNIRINNISIPVDVKKKLYCDLFEQYKKVTPNKIKEYLLANNYCGKEDINTLSGIDTIIKASLSSYIQFKRLLTNNILTESEVEDIIERRTFTEERNRFKKWLTEKYKVLSEEDINYISGLKFKDFGRLSRKFLSGIEGVSKKTGEVGNINYFLWESNDNLQILLSDKYSFNDQIQEITHLYYDQNPMSLDKRLDELYVSNSVKRQIFRSLDIVNDVVKAMGNPPQKIFVEMARGGKPEQKGKRTSSRKEQLLDLYKQVDSEDVRVVQHQINEMGDKADTLLQSESLFLYYLQLGKCMYSGDPIDITKLKDGTYNVDHIYPQSRVKDDSILNNKVLVRSEINSRKSNDIVNSDIQAKMKPYWGMLKRNGLITEEKYNRLIRNKPFTEEEKREFINRQLVETRQSTKVITQILKERFPNAQIVYVKAGLVSDFRHEFDMLKSRAVNDLHHAKDAFLNIVCGNVYHERFTEKWFLQYLNSDYTIKTDKMFYMRMSNDGKSFWNGKESLEAVRKTMAGNQIHMVPFTYIRSSGQSGGLFNQMPERANGGLIPRKAGLNPEKYGGYNNLTCAGFALVKYSYGKKREISFVPIETIYFEDFNKEQNFRINYVIRQIKELFNKEAKDVCVLFNNRILKINTIIELDKYRCCIVSKTGGTRIGLKPFMPLILEQEKENYIKHLENFVKKNEEKQLVYDSEKDIINVNENTVLFDVLNDKLSNTFYAKKPCLSLDTIKETRATFIESDIFEQAKQLLNLVSAFGRVLIKDDCLGIVAYCRLSMNLSNWKQYKDVRIIDSSASGIWEKKSENILELL